MTPFFAALSFVTLSLIAPVHAAEFGTKDEAVAMVKRVQAQFKKDGAEATFKAVSDKSIEDISRPRSVSVHLHDMAPDGVNVAHGARPALIGKNLIDLKDQDGKYLVREMINIANGPGSGWFDYKWPNPINNKIEDKSSYVEKMGDYMVGVGVYRSQFVSRHLISPKRRDAFLNGRHLRAGGAFVPRKSVDPGQGVRGVGGAAGLLDPARRDRLRDAGQVAGGLHTLSHTILPRQQAFARQGRDRRRADEDIPLRVLGQQRRKPALLKSLSSQIDAILRDRPRHRALTAGRTLAKRKTGSEGPRRAVEDYESAAKDTLEVGSTDAPMATMMLGSADESS